MAPESKSRPLSSHPAARRRWTPATLVALAGCAALAVGGASMTSTAGAQTRAAAAAAPSAQVVVDEAPRAGVLTLRSGTFDLNEQATSLRDAVAARRDGAVDRRLLQLDAPMNPHRRELLERAGIRLGDYLGDNTFVADIAGAQADRLDGINFVSLAAQLQPRMKLDSEIGVRPFFTPERQALRDRGETLLMVTLYPDADLNAAILALDAAPGAATISVDANGDHPTLIVSAPAGVAPALAQIDDVQFIEEAPEPTLRNSSTRWIIQSNVSNVTPLYANGLTGQDQVVAVIDGRVDVNHCSFVDPAHPVVTGVVNPNHRKILAYNTTLGSDSHGTHVAGTAVGDAGTTGDTRGIAYDAKLVYHAIPGFSDGSTGNTFYARLELHHNQGARLHTNSWGDDGTTAYTGWCNAIDRFSRDYEESMVMLAVTNTSTLKTPENAKSVLAVGATSDAPNQHLHCTGGAGPTQDGRRKPEIYAPGCGTVSSRWNTSCNTTSSSGTSMASPAIAGAAALVRQYFVEGYYPTGAPNPADAMIPTGALLRATLINASQDMTGVIGYPSNAEGWGRLLADAALHFDGQTRTLRVFDVRNADADALSTGLTREHTINVTGSTQQLRVTMAFTDVPGAIGAFNPVVNNIDLEVESPSGAIYRGNVFSGGVSDTGGAADAINSIEQVHVNSPETGAWTIRVKGTAVNSGTQGYAIAATGELATVCPGDINGDGEVNGADLGLLLGAWGTNDPAADLNASGSVDGADLGLLLGAWGPCN